MLRLPRSRGKIICNKWSFTNRRRMRVSFRLLHQFSPSASKCRHCRSHCNLPNTCHPPCNCIINNLQHPSHRPKPRGHQCSSLASCKSHLQLVTTPLVKYSHHKIYLVRIYLQSSRSSGLQNLRQIARESLWQ